MGFSWELFRHFEYEEKQNLMFELIIFLAERGCEVSEDRCAQSARRSGGFHLWGQRHALAGPSKPDPPLRCGAHTPNEDGSGHTEMHTHREKYTDR